MDDIIPPQTETTPPPKKRPPITLTPEKDGQIDNITGGLMIGTAIAYDLANAGINLIPIAGTIAASFISVFAGMHFWLWFKLHGVSFSKNPSRALSFFGCELIEFIPVLNVLPATTLGVFLTISSTRVEALVGLKSPTKGGVVPIQNK